MADNRKTVKVPEPIFDDLNRTRKSHRMSWPAFLVEMHRQFTNPDADEIADTIANRMDTVDADDVRTEAYRGAREAIDELAT